MMVVDDGYWMSAIDFPGGWPARLQARNWKRGGKKTRAKLSQKIQEPKDGTVADLSQLGLIFTRVMTQELGWLLRLYPTSDHIL